MGKNGTKFSVTTTGIVPQGISSWVVVTVVSIDCFCCS